MTLSRNISVQINVYRLPNSHILSIKNTYHLKALWYLYSLSTITGTWSSLQGTNPITSSKISKKKILLKALWKTSIFVLHENHALPQFAVHTDLLKKKKNPTLNELLLLMSGQRQRNKYALLSLMSYDGPLKADSGTNVVVSRNKIAKDSIFGSF